jgi:hypothetical protein
MKKLVQPFFFLFLFNSNILGMEIYDLQKNILLELAQNVHRYVASYCNKGFRAQETSRIIGYVSFINWDLYKELNKERNDPVTASKIILHVLCRNNEDFTLHEAEKLSFPGAQKCLALSNELYDYSLTPGRIETLLEQGASLYYKKTNTEPLLQHWCTKYRCSDNIRALNNVKKLLELGIDHNKYNILGGLILMASRPNIDNLIITLLQYPTKKTVGLWKKIITKQELVDFLIPLSTPDELNKGLIACLHKYKQYNPNLMQQFINSGADPDKALNRAMNLLFNWNQQTRDNVDSFTDDALNKFTFLCQQGGFNQDVLLTLKDKRETIDNLILMLEKNQTQRDIKHETSL